MSGADEFGVDVDPAGAARGAVVVGVHSGEECLPVVLWAAEQAWRRSAPLLLLHAEPYPFAGDSMGAVWAGEVAEQLDRDARERLHRLAGKVHDEVPELDVRVQVVHDNRRHALLRASAGARLVVTGPGRRRGALGELLLGSTSLFLVAHVSCPVVVVRSGAGGEGAERSRSGVVLGSDGSGAARAAEAFAASHARAHGEALTVVRVWRSPVPRSRVDADVSAAAREQARLEAEHGLEGALERVRAAVPGLVVHGRLVEDAHPAEALLAAGAGARLLVVGSRGRGAFARALLGSTSHEVVHHAHGPVAVVPDAERRG
ncbi:universal stress protein [Kineococcus gypseus]|uniref:universal stress protein n=1 Tax=Kineococcus gypseus TaxID=1637102 RepID=UPI003D7EDC65